ncbi:MFS transporter [Bosea vaviloviae]|uniref:Transporter n=1 Tax=Bosea vaviloviae TaxID=1526658 RepID=A0A1D7U5V0_9HYPH|nr:MFS transporter [Bosea vaviloviae]AOO82761.1 transporter [Bosea vaviloviae]
MIPRRTTLCLGLSQLISWGISYYLIGSFGELIANDLGWSGAVVYGGFSAALLVMGLTSPLVGRLVDRHGGLPVMAAGALLNAAGCAGLALAETVPAYYVAWICLGLAMRLTLYDAAFAALARIGGPQARGPIAQITLLGGLASTLFWPLGAELAAHFGWRGALMVYAGIALLSAPLYLAIPNRRYQNPVPRGTATEQRPLATSPRDIAIAGALYAAIATLANFLNAGMSAHMIGILAGLGLAASVSVWIATLRGVGQSLARLCEVLFGRRIEPLTLNLMACVLLPFCFVAGLASGHSSIAAFAFAFCYGAGNGILTITRGTLPLLLFDHRSYGSVVGRLLAPSFFLSATAPVAYASVIRHFGETGALYLSIAIAVLMLIAAALLRLRFRSPQAR